MSLASALERAAGALPDLAPAVRPANGDPAKLLAGLGPAGAGRVLEWLLQQAPAEGAELLAALADEPAGSEAILAVREGELPKGAVKALRRALHRLRSRGTLLPEAPPAPVVARLAPVEDEIGGAFVSELDPTGARLLVLLEANPSGGVRLFEIVGDEERGILDFHVYSAGRRQARGFVQELLARERAAVLEVPRAAAAALLARLAERRDPAPRDFAEWRRHLAPLDAAARPPGELAREALGEAEEGAGLDRVCALVREGELGPWPPPPETLRALAERLREAAAGRVIVSGAARREWLEAALVEAVAEAFPEARRHACAHRLRECAWVLWQRGREADGRACLVAARCFEETPVGAQPVARALLERALGPVLESLRAEEESSLVVPGDSRVLVGR